MCTTRQAFLPPSPSMSLTLHTLCHSISSLSPSPSQPPVSSLSLHLSLVPLHLLFPFFLSPFLHIPPIPSSPIHHASTAVSDENITQSLANEVPLLCYHSEITNRSLSFSPLSSFTSSSIYSFLPFALLPSSKQHLT